MNIHTYLKRINVYHVNNTSLETLQILQYQHMIHIPFENLDVMRDVPIVLDVEAFYEKVVLRQRGGFCYELNGLYYELLKALGFRCQLVSATINRPDGTWARKGSHACTIVTVDGKSYLTDVGFGDSSRTPLPLTGETRQDVSGHYRLKMVDTHIYDVERKRNADTKWDIIIRIDTTPMALEDFTDACVFNQSSPESPFTQKDVVTIATVDGRTTLSGNKLTTTKNGGKQETTINEVEKADIFEKYFQMSRDFIPDE